MTIDEFDLGNDRNLNLRDRDHRYRRADWALCLNVFRACGHDRVVQRLFVRAGNDDLDGAIAVPQRDAAGIGDTRDLLCPHHVVVGVAGCDRLCAALVIACPQICVALFIRAADAGGRVGHAVHAMDIDRHLCDGSFRHVVISADIFGDAEHAGKPVSNGDLFRRQKAQRAWCAHNSPRGDLRAVHA